jgi:chromosomal replication initiator protein
MNAKDAWLATLGQLQIQLNRSTYDTWLRHAELLAYEDGRFVIAVPHAYAKDWIERHLAQSMTRTLSDIFQRACEIQVIVWDPVDETDQGGPLLELADEPPPVGLPGALNPAFTFENFVVGQANHYASLLARAIVDSPIGKYSPVLFYGDMGMGKTHLLQAIAHRLADQARHVLYLTVEDFTTELVAAIRSQDNLAFRNKYRTADAVILDDLQFAEGKTSTQNEIVAIWDALRNHQKTIIFASDRLPCDMVKVSKDARSRFQAGPIASLEPPDLQLRMDILEAKSARRSLTLPPDVRSLIAGRITTSARDLESAVEQLHTYAQLTGQAITLPVARVVLRQLGSLTQQEAIPLSAVLEVTARYYGLTVEDLASRKRTKVIAQARQLAMYLAREETETSLPQIGQALGGRDHSTVVHGCTRIASLLASDPALAQDIAAIRRMLRDGVDAQAESAKPADAASVAERLIRQVARGL